MVVVAKKASPPDPTPEPPARRQVNARLPDKLADALDRYRASHRYPPGYTEIVLEAIQALLEREGFWPPP